MELKYALVRVRPQRIVILIDRNASTGKYLLSVDLLSRIWGGRYCPIIPVDKQNVTPEALEKLARIRPDGVLLAGVDKKKWSSIVEESCQPRFCTSLNKKLIENLYIVNPLKLILADYVIANKVEENIDIAHDNTYLLKFKVLIQ